jgi:hypothetical protein
MTGYKNMNGYNDIKKNKVFLMQKNVKRKHRKIGKIYRLKKATKLRKSAREKMK